MAIDVVSHSASGVMTGTSVRRAGMQQMPTFKRGFTVIFAVSFVVFFVIALLAQVAARQWRPWLPGAEAERSLVGDVKSAVYTFMSYLA